MRFLSLNDWVEGVAQDQSKRAARDYNNQMSQQPDEIDEQEIVNEPAEWEIQQMKSFTVWINMYLKKRNLSITDITHDLSDGRRFKELLEIISSEQLPPLEKKDQRLHKINNVNRCIEFIMKKGVKLTNIGSEEVVDHNRKVILGLIWSVILRFAIQVHEEIRSNDGLLLWVQKKTKDYKGVNVTNFHRSFSDGLAFNALIHAHRPDLLDYNKLDKENAIHNLNQAFDIAEKQLNIPPMLDPENMAAPDPLSVMTYISAFYNEFSKSQVADKAVNRINRALENNEDTSDKIKEYERLASQLLEWIKANSDAFSSYNPEDNTTEELANKINDMSRFRSEEKPPKSKERAQLENLASAIKTRKALQNMPNYNPLKGHSITDINNAWVKLNEYERTLLERLLFLLREALQIENLLKRFYFKCDQQDSWINGKLDPLKVDVTTLMFFELTSVKSKIVEYSNDIESRDSRIVLITNLRNKLNDLKCKEMDNVNQRHSNICDSFRILKEALDSYRIRILEREKELIEIDKKKKEYSYIASEIKGYLENCIEDLNDTFIVNSVTETESLQKELETVKQELSEKEQKIQQARLLDHEISSSSDPANYYCSITISDLESKLLSAKQALASRNDLLAKEVDNQNQNDTIKKDFAKIAEEIYSFRSDAVSQIHSLATASVSLEDHASKLKEIASKINAFYSERIPMLERIGTIMQEKKIYHNERSPHTLESINAEYQQLYDLNVSSLNDVETQIIVRDSGKISEEKLREYRRLFDHFDKEKLNYLDYNNFRFFLTSLEFPVTENDPAGEKEFSRILSIVDPTRSCRITYQKFFEFITAESVETDNAEQILKAFKQIVGDKDYITPDLIKRHFPKRADELMSKMSISSDPDAPPGALNYRSFVASLYGESEL